MVILNISFNFLEDEMITNRLVNKPDNETVHKALKEYVEFLEERYGVYYNNELKHTRLNTPILASYWEGVKWATLATINDLKDILGEDK